MPSWAEEIIKSVSVGSCVFFILAVVIMLAFRLNEGLGMTVLVLSPHHWAAVPGERGGASDYCCFVLHHMLGEGRGGSFQYIGRKQARRVFPSQQFK